MGVKRKVSNPFITIRITKKAESMIRRYAEPEMKKSNISEIKYESAAKIIERIFLNPNYLQKFIKPLHTKPTVAINRFK